MDDVNNMDESVEMAEDSVGSLGRRDFLTKAAAAGAIAWVTPVILSRPVYADVIGGGTPNCRPEFELVCDEFLCPGSSSMAYPGIRIVGTGPNGELECRCSAPGCSGPPSACIKIRNLSNCGSGAQAQTLRAYSSALSSCGPGVAKPSLSTGCWTDLNSQFIFFAPVPNGNPLTGQLNSLGSSCCVRFRVAIWVGGCCDVTGDPAFTCKTFDVALAWNQSTSTVTCEGTTAQCGPTGFTNTPAANSLCPTTMPQNKPCPETPPCT